MKRKIERQDDKEERPERKKGTAWKGEEKEKKKMKRRNQSQHGLE
jgi:hypothetical protein